MPFSIFYKNATSNDLYTAHNNGASWEHNHQILVEQDGIPRIPLRSNSGPSAAGLSLAYKGQSSNDLYTADFDGVFWRGNTRVRGSEIPPAESNRRPGAAVFRNFLFLAYKGESSNDLYVVYRPLEGPWRGNVRISSQPGGISPKSNDGPNLAVFNDNLYLVYKGESSNDLYTAHFDGRSWHGDTRISSQPGGISPKSNYGPSVAVFNGSLYLVYKGESSNHLYTASYDGRRWSGNTRISSQPGGISPKSNYNPGVATVGKALILAYKGESSNDLYTASYDGERWSGDIRISSQPGGISPQSDRSPSIALA